MSALRPFTETDRRVAALAVSRFGVDRARLTSTVRAHRRDGDESPRDLIAALVGESLLTPAQANEIRALLAKTVLAVNRTGDAGSGTRPSGERDVRRIAGMPLLRRLGSGGMSSVYLAYDEAAGRQVAVKILPENLAHNDEFVARFYREARSVLALDHPNLVHGLSVGHDSAVDRHYLVMEFVDGPSALDLLAKYGRLAVGDAVHIALEVARALEHAHGRSIIHRDIKPDNILLTRSGEAKLADLGLAKRTDDSSPLTGTQQGFGTPFYMPYEQARNARDADGRSDIYALGATLYHLLTGEVPFAHENPLLMSELKRTGDFTPASRLNPAVPPALDEILARMMARDRSERYQTASELIVDLERSRLAAAVPSFVDSDVALRDPQVRARLLAPAKPTQIDHNRPADRPVTIADTPAADARGGRRLLSRIGLGLVVVGVFAAVTALSYYLCGQ